MTITRKQGKDQVEKRGNYIQTRKKSRLCSLSCFVIVLCLSFKKDQSIAIKPQQKVHKVDLALSHKHAASELLTIGVLLKHSKYIKKPLTLL